MKPSALLQRCRQGKTANIRFRDLCRLIEALGFTLVRIEGSHRIYYHPNLPEFVNVQPVGADAKPYQVRQVIRLADDFGLSLGQDQP